MFVHFGASENYINHKRQHSLLAIAKKQQFIELFPLKVPTQSL